MSILDIRNGQVNTFGGTIYFAVDRTSMTEVIQRTRVVILFKI